MIFASSLLWVWSLVAKIQEHRLKVFDNCVLRETYGSEEGRDNKAVEHIA